MLDRRRKQAGFRDPQKTLDQDGGVLHSFPASDRKGENFRSTAKLPSGLPIRDVRERRRHAILLLRGPDSSMANPRPPHHRFESPLLKHHINLCNEEIEQ